jgi:hypothetical protein
MCTTADLTVDFTGSTGSFGFIESFLNGISLKKLHVQMFREEKADIVKNLRLRIDGNYNWNVTTEENLTYFLRVTCRDKC